MLSPLALHHTIDRNIVGLEKEGLCRGCMSRTRDPEAAATKESLESGVADACNNPSELYDTRKSCKESAPAPRGAVISYGAWGEFVFSWETWNPY